MEALKLKMVMHFSKMLACFFKNADMFFKNADVFFKYADVFFKNADVFFKNDDLTFKNGGIRFFKNAAVCSENGDQIDGDFLCRGTERSGNESSRSLEPGVHVKPKWRKNRALRRKTYPCVILYEGRPGVPLKVLGDLDVETEAFSSIFFADKMSQNTSSA